ncbi:MAG: thioredoxin-disulfide reductase [Elusimicrobia bacterium]|nr:thioredoxin-disulfide reductase [Elusimicrobiota bacterium]
MKIENRKAVIIGSGPAGCTAAIYAARADLKPLLYGGAAMGGQLMITSEVENFPGFPEPILGPDLMDRMRRQAERLGVPIIQELVSKADLKQRPFRLESTEGRLTLAETLILATGSEAKWLGLESEKRLRGKGVSACATCDGFFFKGGEVVVVGGGDAALEEASFLTHFAAKASVVHRRSELRASKILQERAFGNPKIAFIFESVVDDILGSEKVSGVRLKNVKTGALSELRCGGVFVAVGHEPNTAVFKGQVEMDDAGYLKTDGRTRTSVPGVFAAGDCSDPRYRQAVVAAGSGCMAALEAGRFLAEKP